MTPRSVPRLRSATLATTAAAVLVIATAVPASASVTVNINGQISSDSDPDVINVSCVNGKLTANGMTADELCSALTGISVSAGGGNDTVNLGALTSAMLPALVGLSVYTEGSYPYDADNVNGSDFGESYIGDPADTINAAGGNDMIVGANSASGGAGDDSFMEISGFASGGTGDDRFIQFTTAGGIDGGPGTDSWEIDFDQATLGVGDVTVGFAMSDTGLTAEVPGQPQQFIPASGLEQIFFTLLRQGTQSYDGGAFSGTQHVRGMAGPDTISGGSGDDALFGGSGPDTLTGGPGVDVINGGDGNDTIQARDGVADKVDCGAGTDSVVADAADMLVGCETIDQPAPPAPAPAPPAQVVLVPVVPVTNAIAGPGKVKKGKVGTFTFGSPTAGATFQCQLDDDAWKTCASAYKVKTKKLKAGKHALLVRAVVGGAADATPSKKAFKVRKG